MAIKCFVLGLIHMTVGYAITARATLGYTFREWLSVCCGV